jgi:hypothetical protein
MKYITFLNCIFIFLSTIVQTQAQTVTTPSGNPNPTSTQSLCAYKFISDPGVNFEEWVFEWSSMNRLIVNSSGVPYYNGIYDSIMYLKWFNIEANAISLIFKAQYRRNGKNIGRRSQLDHLL